VDTLQVRIVSPKGEVFKGEATAVSSRNSVGNFDILPQHANFVTLVRSEKIVVRLISGKAVEFKYDLAIVHAGLGKVDIYTDVPEEMTAK